MTAVLLMCGSIAFHAVGIVAIKKRRILGAVSSTLLGLLPFSLAALCATLSVATQGYRAPISELVAALVTIQPLGSQRFSAAFRFADGRDTTFTLDGDDIYVAAHSLTRRPIANMLGLRTTYELDGVGGRYTAFADQQVKPRTIFALSRPKRLDMFDLRRRYALLAPLLDAAYGSATFTGASTPSTSEVRVSTSGLSIRRVNRSPPGVLDPVESQEGEEVKTEAALSTWGAEDLSSAPPRRRG